MPGDCINRLTHVTSLASDSRYQPEVAASAAVRYDADRMSSAHLGSQLSHGREQSRELLGRRMSYFDRSEAERFLQEEPGAANTRKVGGAALSNRSSSDVSNLRECFKAVLALRPRCVRQARGPLRQGTCLPLLCQATERLYRQQPYGFDQSARSAVWQRCSFDEA